MVGRLYSRVGLSLSYSGFPQSMRIESAILSYNELSDFVHGRDFPAFFDKSVHKGVNNRFLPRAEIQENSVASL